jgi:putative endonuclease
MITLKRQIGNLGEKLAKKFLKKKGYKIIKENYLKREGEIDLIAVDKEDLVFIEVKTRKKGSTYGWPEEAVDYSKQKKLIKTAQKYLYDYRGPLKNFRIDVISVEIDKEENKAFIKHFENILYF